jgi:DNA-binding transcriptional regulator YdaS (Cro superfamily)
MKLSEYVYEPGKRGRQSDLALAIGCQPQLMWQWASGVRRVPDARCAAIERATDGAVTVEELRPDVHWLRVRDAEWPHPAGRPLIDVGAVAA